LTDGLGRRRDILLGKYGTAASRHEYARVLAEWEVSGRSIPRPAGDLTINELLLRFMEYAQEHYRHADGRPGQELVHYRRTLKPLRVLYGATPAREFSPLALKAVRSAMIDGSWMAEAESERRRRCGHRLDCCRRTVNQRVNRIRHVFKWAVENELVPPSVLHGLQAVRGLQAGRSAARETKPVKPVPMAFIDAIIPHVRPPIAAMIELQLVTGMRPGEVTIMRACDLDTSGDIWLYRPPVHKTSYRGHERVIAIGPRGQEILKPFLKPDLQAYLFSPKDALTQYRALLRAKRKTKVQPSQMNRRKRRPRKGPKDFYTVASYCRSIADACKKADVPHWHPHQLRHNRATEIRKTFGLDAARVALGHRSPQITETYAEIDIGRAIEVAAKIG
jgi:integrase